MSSGIKKKFIDKTPILLLTKLLTIATSNVMAQDPPTYAPSEPLTPTRFLNSFPSINVQVFNPAIYHAPEPHPPSMNPQGAPSTLSKAQSKEKIIDILRAAAEAAWKSPDFLVKSSYLITDPVALGTELSKFYGDPNHTQIRTSFCKHLAETSTGFSKIRDHLAERPAKLPRFVMFDIFSFFDPMFMERASRALEEKLLGILDKENSRGPVDIFDEDGKTHRYPSITNAKEYFKHYMLTLGKDYKQFRTFSRLDEDQWKYFSNKAKKLRENERIQMLAYIKKRILKRTQNSGRPSRNSQQPLLSRGPTQDVVAHQRLFSDSQSPLLTQAQRSQPMAIEDPFVAPQNRLPTQNQYQQSYNDWAAQNLRFGPGFSTFGTPIGSPRTLPRQDSHPSTPQNRLPTQNQYQQSYNDWAAQNLHFGPGFSNFGTPIGSPRTLPRQDSHPNTPQNRPPTQNQYQQSYDDWAAQNLRFGPGLSEAGTPRNIQSNASPKTNSLAPTPVIHTAIEIESESPTAEVDESQVARDLRMIAELAWARAGFLTRTDYPVAEPKKLSKQLEKLHGEKDTRRPSKNPTRFFQYIHEFTSDSKYRFLNITQKLSQSEAYLTQSQIFILLKYFDPEFLYRSSLLLERKILELLEPNRTGASQPIFDEELFLEDGSKKERYPSFYIEKDYFKLYVDSLGIKETEFKKFAKMDPRAWDDFKRWDQALSPFEKSKMRAFIQEQAKIQPYSKLRSKFQTGAAPCIAPAQDPIGNQQLSTLSQPLRFP